MTAVREVPGELRAAFEQAGQGHVFQFWNELTEDARARLLKDLRRVDLEQLNEFARLAGGPPGASPVSRRPAPVLELSDEPEGWTREGARALGGELLRSGRCGVVLVAGGQGSRLGFKGPKGCYPIAPLSGKTLFQLHAEKLRRLGEIHGTTPALYVMASPENDLATREFFAAHDCFGLDAEAVHIFPQDVNPALTPDGRLLLAAKDKLALSPNGNGGLYQAFLESGALDDADRRGLEHLFYMAVDNPLVRILDPLFLGVHAHHRAEISLKVLRKTGPQEKVGVVALEDGHHAVVEYSDFAPEEAQATDASGALVYWAATIGLHLFTIEFFRQAAEGAVELPIHVAPEKSVDAIDATGAPQKVLCSKFETFAFDALRHAERVVNLEVERAAEFAPVKRGEGDVDSVRSARNLMIEEHRRWLRHCGIEATGRVEISPRVAIDEEDLATTLHDGGAAASYDGDLLIERDPATGAITFHQRDPERA